MRVFVGKGDRVIIPKPFWVSYSQQVIMSEGIPEFVDFSSDLRIDLEHFLKLAQKYGSDRGDSSAKLFILNSPSNPTGVVCSREEIEKIGEICLKNNIFIISDEVYEKFLYGTAKHCSVAAFSDELKAISITINAVSKTYAMTGWRIGYCACDRRIIQQMTKVQDQSTSNPNTPAQWAAIEALEGQQDSVEIMRKEYEKRRDYIFKRIQEIEGMECALPDGAFYVFPKISNFYNKKIKSSFDFAGELLSKAAVAIVPGGAFGDENYIRISYATTLEKIKEGMDRIANFCKEIS
jgi:aspartate aminotransferase